MADSSTTYRSRYLASIRTRYVLELLMSDVSNPRSVAYQIAAVAERIQGLPGHVEERAASSGPPELALALRVGRLLQDPNMDDLKRRDAHGKRPALEQHLQAVRSAMADLATALAARYLSHSVPSPLKLS